MRAVVERRETERVAVVLEWARGAADDPPGRRGMAHLAEHLVFRGTPGLRDGELDRRLAAVGGQSGAWTGRTRTVVSLVGPAGAEVELAALARSVARGPEPTDEGVAVELQVLARERAELEDDPDLPARESVERTLWGPAGEPRGGLPAALAGVTAAEVAAWLHAEPVVAFVGPVDAAARLEAGPLESVPREDLRPPVRSARVGDVYGWATVPEGHPDAGALDAAARLLGAWTGAPSAASADWTWGQVLVGPVPRDELVGALRRLRHPGARATAWARVETWRDLAHALEAPLGRAARLAHALAGGMAGIPTGGDVSSGRIAAAARRWLTWPPETER